MSAAAESNSADLMSFLAGYEHLPRDYVDVAYPWGTERLQHDGPREWQDELMTGMQEWCQGDRSMPYQVSRSSGHGIGKSAVMAWTADWGLSTKPGTKCVFTANTDSQLRKKTWSEMAKWHHLSLSRGLFTCTATSIFANDEKDKLIWRADAVPWSERNPEAFQGLHNEGKRIILGFDEASAIPDIIWETAEGAQTDEDLEMIWLVFGNPTRNTGRFRQTFRKHADEWDHARIDARDVPGTNKKLFAKWAKREGEDSDFFRVRVKGMFPNASISQFIPLDRVEKAAAREPSEVLSDEPLIMAVDCARGSDRAVIAFRRGRDAQSIPMIVLTDTKDSTRFENAIVNTIDEWDPDHVIFDEGGVGGPILDHIRQRGYRHARGVEFGGSPDDPRRWRNKRIEMYALFREWAKTGSIIDDDDLIEELTSMDAIPVDGQQDKLKLEPKEDIILKLGRSPDMADALAMTFAFKFNRKDSKLSRRTRRGRKARTEYDQFAPTHKRRKRSTYRAPGIGS